MNMAASASSSSCLRNRLPQVRGRLAADVPLSGYTWFRAGGVAEALYTPADLEDMAAFLGACPGDIPVSVIGVGSNLLIRDGGLRGVVIRPGRGFGTIQSEGKNRLRVGVGALDKAVARAAGQAGIAGLEFLHGIPGSVGGALRMNAGAHGREIKDVLVEARGVTREGVIETFSRAAMGFGYRRSSVPEGVIFVEALLQGSAGVKEDIAQRMQEIVQIREEAQPVRSRTGGSTFKNPEGHKAWQLIDAAGCRGLVVGDAQVSELHCNFLINRGNASAADLEQLGEEVRRRVKEHSGVALEWEIRRIGEPAP